ncbi:hypothetical protein [Streptomyces goshikiensis]
MATLVLAGFTRSLASRTKSLAEETAADQRAQWRPVLLPGPEGTISNRKLSVEVRNAGRGPALFVRAQLEGEVVLTSPLDWGGGALAPSDIQQLIFEDVRDHSVPVQLLLDYRDLAGRSYATSITLVRRGEESVYAYDVRWWEDHTVTTQGDAFYPQPGTTDVSPEGQKGQARLQNKLNNKEGNW